MMKLDARWLLEVMRDTVRAAREAEGEWDWFILSRACGETIKGVCTIVHGRGLWTIYRDGDPVHEGPIEWAQAVRVACDTLDLDPPQRVALPHAPRPLRLPRSGGRVAVVDDREI